MNEPWGEGCGWDDCLPADARGWGVELYTGTPCAEIVESYDTREEADANMWDLVAQGWNKSCL